MSANEYPNEQHKQNSNPKPPIEFEPSLQEGPAATAEPNLKPTVVPERAYPLGMVLGACPDIIDYAKGGITHWRDLLAAAAVVRSMLGISPSAWEEAQTVMGETQASIVIACRLCHVNLNWPREVSTSQFEFMRLSQLATSGKLLLGRRGACAGM
jgi:replication initiation protein RepC